MINVLCVCTFNQTRSVMMAELLRVHALMRGVPVTIDSAGTMASGLFPTTPTVRSLAERGIDVSRRRSQRLTSAAVTAATLVLCAERRHVISIGATSAAFPKTFTLPEFLELASAAPLRDEQEALDEWIAALGAARDPRDYVAGSGAEIADPNGSSPRQFERVTAAVDAAMATVLDILV